MAESAVAVPEPVRSRVKLSRAEIEEEHGISTAIELQDRLHGRQIQGPTTQVPVAASAGSVSTTRIKNRFRRFWRAHVSIRVPPDQRRDHLSLERTFLAYLRTSLALSMAGTTIAQLLHLTDPVIAVGLYAGFVAGSIVVVILAAVRFWRQQVAMAERGKVWAGGFEMFAIFVTFLAVAIATFAVAIMISDDAD